MPLPRRSLPVPRSTPERPVLAHLAKLPARLRCQLVGGYVLQVLHLIQASLQHFHAQHGLFATSRQQRAFHGCRTAFVLLQRAFHGCRPLFFIPFFSFIVPSSVPRLPSHLGSWIVAFAVIDATCSTLAPCPQRVLLSADADVDLLMHVVVKLVRLLLVYVNKDRVYVFDGVCVCDCNIYRSCK